MSVMPTVHGDEAWRRREKARRTKEITVQVLLLGVLLLIGAMFAHNVTQNLEANHVRSGLEFLTQEAGFDIGETSLPYSSSDSFWWALMVGLCNTIKVSLLSIVAATILGVVVGFMRLSLHPAIRFLGTAHVEFYRNIPLLVLLLMIYLSVTELFPRPGDAFHIGDWFFLSKTGLQFAVPLMDWWAVGISAILGIVAGWVVRNRFKVKYTSQVATVAGLAAMSVGFVLFWCLCGAVGGWDHPEATRFNLVGGGQMTPEFLSLWLGLTLFTSASIAEIVRAGVVSVPPGQWRAGLALGLTRSETITYVIFPQSMRLIIPPLSSQFMSLTKNSSLAVIVGYPDLVSVANTTINISAQALEVIVLIMVIYLMVNLVTSFIMNAINRRVMQSVI